MSKLCSQCNKYPVFSKGLCKYHQPKYKIKKVTSKQKVKIEEKKELTEEDKLFYQAIWEESEWHQCYECGIFLGSEPLTTYFHHILEKRNYPQFRHKKENIVILCSCCHNQVERFIDKCPKTQLLTQKIKEWLIP